MLARLLAVVAVLTACLAPWPGPVARSEPGPRAVDRSVAEGQTSALVGLIGVSTFEELVTRHIPARAATLDAAWAAGRGIDVAAIDDAVRRRQDRVAAAAERLGITVISRYSTAANGLLVHATASQLAALRAVRGVSFVEPAPIVRPALTRSAAHIGAARLARARGYDGTGSIVAIIDTGVDYTHKMLGGPGTVEAWQAASRPGATEVITDTWEGKPLFPNDKFAGGYDFVGPRYDPPHVCTPQRQATTNCTSIPEPDSDPLDGAGHGTHVAGIVAGQGVDAIGDGVAPGAKLVGLKLYGSGGADEAADVLVDSIEWCARVNLGIETRGVVPPRVDAVNISLGENWAQGSRMFDQAVEAAVGTGIVIAASAGNSGDRAFIVGTPSASPKILSVASTLPPMPGIDVVVRAGDQEATFIGVESFAARQLAAGERIEAGLAWFGRGCNGDAQAQEVREQVALVQRGVCGQDEKVRNAQAAGAIAVVMYTDGNPKTRIGGDPAGIAIPAVMIDRQAGEDLVKQLTGGATATVVVDARTRKLFSDDADSVAGYSSRGPSKNGALKPDISAPGTGIVSAWMGAGDRGIMFGGTSMASPHIAGVAALMHQRNRAERLGLGGADLAALMMNYAQPVVFQYGTDHIPVPVVRQGAGVVDVWRSGTGDLVVRAGDIASLNLGPTALLDAADVSRIFDERTLAVRNLSDDPVTFKVTAEVFSAADRDQGLAVEVPTAPVTLAGKAETTVKVAFNFEPEKLRPWTLRPAAGASTAAVDALEIDGHVSLAPVDAGGQPIEDAPVARVPFFSLPRRASWVRSAGMTDLPERRGTTISFVNGSPFAGDAEILAVPMLAEAGGDVAPAAPEDPDEPDVLHELDLRRVGARYEPAGDGRPETMLTFGLVRHATAAIPLVSRYEIYLDTDRDGVADHRVREGAAGDRMQTYFAGWDAAAGAVRGTEAITGTRHATDLHTRVSLFSVPIAALGMGAPGPIDFYVVHRGLTEDWLFTPSADVAPDGADAPNGPRYRFDPSRTAPAPARWSITVPAHGRTDVALNGTGDAGAAWLALYPDNRFDGPDGQMQVIAAERPTVRLSLPLVQWGPVDR